MAASEQVAKTASVDPNAPDPNVIIPDHVREASSAADKLHEQFYPKNPAQEMAPNKEAIPQPVQPEPVRQDVTPTAEEIAARAAAPQDPGQQEQHPAPSEADRQVDAEGWRHRFLSMQGRYNAAAKTIGTMEEQMRQMGVELVRTQKMLEQPQQQADNRAPLGHNHEKLITDEDRANYGDELIDLARRAARETVSPELEQLRSANSDLKKQVSVSSRRELFAELDRVIPNWRQINTSVQFKGWLRLPNIYTGTIRGTMLKDAVDGAQAPKVIALFRDFLAEANATGQTVPAARTEQNQAPGTQQQQPNPPRDPALDLTTLAAPGRARPASGDSQVPSEKPIYSRADISKFYDEKRRGLYAHRQKEAQDFENDLTAAQREGRIRG